MPRPIDADAVLYEIHELKKSPWYNGVDGNYERLIRADAVGVITDLCIKQAPTLDYVPRQQWISVNDRLPERYNNYLVYYSEIDEFEVIEYGYGSWVTPEGDVPDYPVTHWMPLPEPPKEA